MLHRFRDRFGTAGLVVAVVALVAALTGTALAASGALTGKQKKEVEKIAKKYAGKPGAPGATGPAGPAGAAGAKGDTGSSGSNGSNGKSVVTTSISTSGLEGQCVGVGGTRFEVEGSGIKNYVCNGEEGEPGATGFVSELPPGKTETGTYAVGPSTEEQKGTFINEPISFPFPLPAGEGFANGGEAKEIPVEYVPTATPTAHCKGSKKNPTADEGFMCVYHSSGNNVTLPEFANIEPETGQFEFGAGRTGVILRFFASAASANGTDSGTWAVTARK